MTFLGALILLHKTGVMHDNYRVWLFILFSRAHSFVCKWRFYRGTTTFLGIKYIQMTRISVNLFHLPYFLCNFIIYLIWHVCDDWFYSFFILWIKTVQSTHANNIFYLFRNSVERYWGLENNNNSYCLQNITR